MGCVARGTGAMVSRRVIGRLAMAMVAAIGTAYAQDTPVAVGGSVEWRVKESFPLLPLSKVEDLRVAELKTAIDVYRRLEAQWEVGKPIVAAVTATQYDKDRRRYKPGYLLQKGDPVIVSARVQGASNEVARSQCAWSVRGAEGQFARSTTAVEPRLCSEWVDLEVPLGVKVKLQARIAVSEGAAADQVAAQKATEPWEEDATVTQRVTVALGDSYAAGQGNPDVPADNRGVTNPKPGPDWPFRSGQDRGPIAVWWDDECQRSLLSWPVLTVLTQAITDDKKTRHILLTYACSGAGVVDGGFLAQIKSSVRGRTYSPVRDGEVDDKNFEQQTLSYQVSRSQINAMYDDLCFDQDRIAKMVSVPARPVTRAWTYRCANPVPVDRLLLSMGGNDLGFPNIAMGIFLPDVAKHRFGWLPLWLFRSFTKAEDPNAVADRVAEYGKIYPKAIQTLREAAGVPASRTVLVVYPNPVVSPGPKGLDDAPANGCVGGRAVTEEKETPQQIRVRDINLVLGWALASSIPIFDIGSEWVLSAEENEVEGFKTVYKHISQMQTEALDIGDADTGKMERATYGNDEHFNGRRLCDRVETANEVYLPLHMCSGNSRQCNAGAAMGGGQWLPRAPAEYKHYSGLQEQTVGGKTVKQPRRSIVYSLNESVLAQRSWPDEQELSGERISDALSGAMHPSAEAYAAAADSILNAIKQSEKKQARRAQLAKGHEQEK